MIVITRKTALVCFSIYNSSASTLNHVAAQGSVDMENEHLDMVSQHEKRMV